MGILLGLRRIDEGARLHFVETVLHVEPPQSCERAGEQDEHLLTVSASTR